MAAASFRLQIEYQEHVPQICGKTSVWRICSCTCWRKAFQSSTSPSRSPQLFRTARSYRSTCSAEEQQLWQQCGQAAQIQSAPTVNKICGLCS